MQKIAKFSARSPCSRTRNYLWNFSSLRFIFLTKAISWVLRTKVHYYTYQHNMWLTNRHIEISKNRTVWDLRGKMRNFRLARNHVYMKYFKVSDLFFWSRPYHEYNTNKSTLLYRHYMWLTNKILRYWRIVLVRFKRQSANISARSLRSVVIIYEISQISTLLTMLAIWWVLRTKVHVVSTVD